MNESPYPPVNRETFHLVLRRVMPETWSQIQLLEKDPTRSLFTFKPDELGLDMKFILTCYLELLIEIVELKTAGTSLPAIRRSEKFLGQVFSDAWSAFGNQVPLMNTITELDSYWYHNGNDWDVPPEGALDEASRVVVAEFVPWSKRYLAERLVRIEAHQKQKRAEARARLPPSRMLPHDPDPESVNTYRQYSRDELAKWQPRLPGTDGLGNPTTDSARQLAEQHLIAALTGHWFLAPIADTLAGLRRGCDYAVRGLSSDPALHAWTYEQWQHVAIVAQHQPLMEMLWNLRRETWDHARIRPVNWLVGRIRLLDLLHRDGAPEDLRDLLEKLRLGLFVEQLPSELTVDLPLMRNWYHVLRGIVLRDPAIITERLIERQGLLADHWTRGGGIAPVSMIDLGGWALLRTARLRGVKPVLFDHAYLPRELQEA
jgi:hypothetical protein